MSKQIMTITGEHQFNELGKRIDGNAESIVEILQNDIQSLGETIRRMSVGTSDMRASSTSFPELNEIRETMRTLQGTLQKILDGQDKSLKLQGTTMITLQRTLDGQDKSLKLQGTTMIVDKVVEKPKPHLSPQTIKDAGLDKMKPIDRWFTFHIPEHDKPVRETMPTIFGPMQQNRLEQYEAKKRKQEIERLEQIRKEKYEKDQQLKKEQEKEKKAEIIQKDISRVAEMVNSSCNAMFIKGGKITENHAGDVGHGMTYHRWGIKRSDWSIIDIPSEFLTEKFIFDIGMITSIRNCDGKLLKTCYDELVQLYIWVDKYVFSDPKLNPYPYDKKLVQPNIDSNRINPIPFIDYLFDHFGKLYSSLQDDLRSNLVSLERMKANTASCSPSAIGFTTALVQAYDTELKALDRIKLSKQKKEYYIVNPDKLREIYTFPDLNCLFGSFLQQASVIGGSDYGSSHCNPSIYLRYYHEKKKILDSFPNIIQKLFGDYLTQLQNIKSYIESIEFNRHQTSYNTGRDFKGYYSTVKRDFLPSDFEPIVSLTKTILDLIEFLRPDLEYT